MTEQLDPNKLKGCPKDCPDRCPDPNCHETCREYIIRTEKNAETNRNRRADVDYSMYKCSSVIETQRKIKSRIRLKNPK